MKLILKEYLASLKERGDLDKALLPNLLSELGLRVINTPMIGTRQHGVDIAAVGKIKGEDKQKYLYLFCIKAGNISRSDWTGNPQSVRPELDEILDVYIRSNIAKENADLPIKICLCCGGELEETVLVNWAGYTDNHTTDKISYEEWNGDRLSEHMMRALLARELLDSDVRNNFQKAVAMVNEPSACYSYTQSLLHGLLSVSPTNKKAQLLKLRQAYICIHTITSWAIDANNYESIYKITELGMLFSWNVIKSEKVRKKPTKHHEQLMGIFDQFAQLYLRMSELYFTKTTYPYCGKLHAISVAVRSREPVDVNLNLFELVGRLAIRGIWTQLLDRLTQQSNPELSKGLAEVTARSVNAIIDTVNSNPVLRSPIKDDHMIEICLIMYLAQVTGSVKRFLPWIGSVATQAASSLIANGPYPTCKRDYIDLLAHPESSDVEYRKEACIGSVLYPYLFLWLPHVLSDDEITDFVSSLDERIPNCTHQAWLPDEDTDELIWKGDTDHGICITGLSPSGGQEKVTNSLNEVLKQCDDLSKISAVQRGLIPLFLMACRHHRLPIPPNFWILSNEAS